MLFILIIPTIQVILGYGGSKQDYNLAMLFYFLLNSSVVFKRVYLLTHITELSNNNKPLEHVLQRVNIKVIAYGRMNDTHDMRISALRDWLMV